MRFTTVLLSGLLAIASAQTTTTTPTTLATVTSTTSESPAETSQSEITKCINACALGDVGCTAKCIAVPNPDPAAVNATNQCVADCPKGNGTATDNLNYQNCLDACIGKYYFTTSTSGAPAATGSGAGTVVTTTDSSGATVTTTSSASAANTQASGSGSGSGSATGSAAPSSTGKNAGEVLRVGSAVGLVGMVAAVLAL